MCSIQAEDEEANIPPVDEMSIDKKFCTKCGLPAVIALRLDDIYCKECFVVRATHKFRCEFGKSRLIRDKEEVLVAFSGGQSSCAMLHLIQEGLSKRAHKKLRFIPNLVYINDDGVSEGHNSLEQPEIVSSIVSRFRETGLKYFVFQLEQVFDRELVPIMSNSDQDDTIELEKLKSVDKSRLKLLMDSLATKTSRESLIHLLRRELLVRICRQLRFGKIVLGDNATSLAARLLSNVVQGRGAHLSQEMGFVDDRHGDVILVRPVREFTEKEIDMYNRLSNIIPSVSSKLQSSISSVDALSKQFVAGLQAEHSATLAIICRTGEKLEAQDNQTAADDRCALCQVSLDAPLAPLSASAINAKAFSSSVCSLLQERNQRLEDVTPSGLKVSTVSTTAAVPSAMELVANAGTANSANGISIKNDCTHLPSLDAHRCSRDDLLTSLCYGCKLILQEMDDGNMLPPSVLEKAKLKVQRDQMRSSIEQFLLEDDDTVASSN